MIPFLLLKMLINLYTYINMITGQLHLGKLAVAIFQK